jgi:hypothetical protein
MKLAAVSWNSPDNSSQASASASGSDDTASASGSHDPASASGSDDPASRSLTDDAGNIDEEAVKAVAIPILERWHRDRTLDAIRSRLVWLFGVSAVVATVGYFVDLPGISGSLLRVWSLACLPIAGIAASVSATIRNPKQARDVWWNSGLFVTLGLVVIAGMARSGERSVVGRAAWQLAFADDSPSGVDYGYDRADDDVDLDRVAELTRWARLAVAGSIAISAIDGAVRIYGAEIVAVLTGAADGTGTDGGTGGGGSGSGGITPPDVGFSVPTDPVEFALLVALLVLVAAVVALVIIVHREL